MSSEQVIFSLLQQQFWDPPDCITDRTRTKRLRVVGSNQVLETMVLTLMGGTEYLDGSLDSYYSYLRKVSKKLGLEEQTVITNFNEKISDLRLIQNVFDDNVLLVFAVGSIISTIREIRQRNVLTIIRNAVRERAEREWTIRDETELTEKLNLLFQTSDSELSLLLNLSVLEKIANCFNFCIASHLVEDYAQKVISRLSQ